MQGTHDRIIEPLRQFAIPLDSLVQDPANARRHPAKNIDAIKASLAAFGQRTPLVVQRQGMIVRKGNGTLEAARALGWDVIAALVVDEGDVPATAYALADNRSGELAEWDFDALAMHLVALDGTDMPPSVLCWDANEYAEISGAFAPTDIDSQGKLGVCGTVTCPQCGHEFIRS